MITLNDARYSPSPAEWSPSRTNGFPDLGMPSGPRTSSSTSLSPISCSRSMARLSRTMAVVTGSIAYEMTAKHTNATSMCTASAAEDQTAQFSPLQAALTERNNIVDGATQVRSA